MAFTTTSLVCAALFAAVAAARVSHLRSDPSDCTQYTAEKACDANSTCTWCNCSAIPSECWTKADAKKLPPGVYVCDSAAAELDTPLFGGWKVAGDATANDQVSMHLALRHSAETTAAIDALFKAVSDVDGPQYGQYLDQHQLAALAAPQAGALQSTLDFCRTRSLACRVVGSGDLVEAQGTADDVAAAFGVRLQRFTHARHGKTIVRTLDTLVIPGPLSKHVAAISALEQFPNLDLVEHKKTNAAPQVTPAMLKGSTLYNITDTASAGSKASQAVAEFQGQGYLPSDLALFESTFQLPAQPCRNVTGPPDTTKGAGVEASLDIQYIIATGTGVPSDFYLDASQAFDLFDWTGAVLNASNPALVWSVSYGEGVNGGNGGVIKPDYVNRFNVEMQKFGLRGMTVFVASGDSGVYNRIPFENGKFHPSFPACVPAVTAVGSTELNADGSETTAVSFSGGGFTPSNYFVRANASQWQDVAVNAYLNSKVAFPPRKYWDRNGRGIPDVSAVGVDYAVFTQGHKQGVSGTSASTPAVAGIFGLLNDQRLAKGMPPLGFVNPFIYANPHAFRDIKLGYNNGGGIKLLKKGFYATAGWDPVTGLGTPNYIALKAAALRPANTASAHQG